MKKNSVILFLCLAGCTAVNAFTTDTALDTDTAVVKYQAPYSFKVSDKHLEVTFTTDTTEQLSMVLSDESGQVIFSKDNVQPDQKKTVTIPLNDTSVPMTLQVKCTTFTGKTYFPGGR